MIIHKCDKCGKEMGAWLEVSTTVNASNLYTNVFDLQVLAVSREFCKDCYTKIFLSGEEGE